MSFADRINELADHSPNPPSLIARDLVGGPDQAELNDWLLANAQRFVAADVAERRRKNRHKERDTAHRETVKAGIAQRSTNLPAPSRSEPTVRGAALEAARGNFAALTSFALVMQCPDGEKPLGEMDARDHRYVADQLQQISTSSQLLAMVHRKIGTLLAERRGATTASVMTPEQYGQLVERLVGSRRHELVP